MKKMLKFHGSICLLLLLSGCDSCGGPFESDYATEKRELCEDTGGEPSKSHGCSQPFDDGISCSASPNCPDAVPNGPKRNVHCECPPGVLYDDDEGCKPNPDPLCLNAASAEKFEAHVRTLLVEDIQECGRQLYKHPVKTEIHTCLTEAQHNKTPALAIFERTQGVYVISIDGQGAMIAAMYSNVDDVSISRWRCQSPEPLVNADQNALSYEIFECPSSWQYYSENER